MTPPLYFIIGLITGLFVGGAVGVLIMALVTVAGRGDE